MMRFVLLFLPLLPLAGCQAVPFSDENPPRLVFAHYMVCCPVAGGGASVADYQQEILAAQQAGIDGFALNCGGWTQREPHYKQRCQLIYQAARDWGTDFKLFISADFCCGLTTDEVRDMVETFRDHPNQFRWEGQPVLSTFSGWTNITAYVEGEFTGDRDICYVPFYYPHPAAENPGLEALEQIALLNPSLDGYFSFGAAGTPEAIVASCRNAAQIWRGMGKIYMHPVTPFYRGLGGNYRIYESRGFEGMAQQWENAIRTDANWIEIVTWNDWGESSYVAPFGNPDKTNLRNGHWGAMLSHTGFLNASRYYIDWFKTGRPSRIVRDQVYYFYRLHPKNLEGCVDPGCADHGRPHHANELEDRIFATLFLAQPARLTITCGNQRQTFELAAGVRHVSLPMVAGTPRFILERHGRILIDKTGEQTISATDSWSNFNYFSGSATAELTPQAEED